MPADEIIEILIDNVLIEKPPEITLLEKVVVALCILAGAGGIAYSAVAK